MTTAKRNLEILDSIKKGVEYSRIQRQEREVKSALQYAKEMNDMDRMIYMTAYTSQSRREGTAFLLAWFCLDRVYLSQIFLSIFKIVLCFFIIGFLWVVVDLFTVKSRTREFNRHLAHALKREMGI